VTNKDIAGEMIKAIEKTLNLKFKTATKINLKPRVCSKWLL
jgi:hypothetical protein